MNLELEKKIRIMMSQEYKKFITERERLNSLKNDMIEKETQFHEDYKNFQKFKYEVRNLENLIK